MSVCEHACECECEREHVWDCFYCSPVLVVASGFDSGNMHTNENLLQQDFSLNVMLSLLVVNINSP